MPPLGAGEVSPVKALPVAIWASPAWSSAASPVGARRRGGVLVVMALRIELRRVAGLWLRSREMLALWGCSPLVWEAGGDGRAV